MAKPIHHGARYVLIDYMHLAYKCIATAPLSATIKQGNELVTVNTTIPNYTTKWVYKYGGRGLHLTGVFLEGGNARRKEYFKDQMVTKKGKDGAEYKGGRPLRGELFRGVDLAVNLMARGKVSLYRQENHEADDCIISMVTKIKQTDTTTPIDIITGDSDLLALVDDQVSVYMRGSRQHAEDGCPEHHLYYQVTPETWEEYLTYTSAYKDFYIPYNSMLLFKMVRGDKTDNITGACKGYGGVKFSQLTRQMEADGVDFANIFRYFKDFDTDIRPTLENYFSKEEVDYMGYIYNGINPTYVDLMVPKQMDLGLLQASVQELKINLLA